MFLKVIDSIWGLFFLLEYYINILWRYFMLINMVFFLFLCNWFLKRCDYLFFMYNIFFMLMYLFYFWYKWNILLFLLLKWLKIFKYFFFWILKIENFVFLEIVSMIFKNVCINFFFRLSKCYLYLFLLLLFYFYWDIV